MLDWSIKTAHVGSQKYPWWESRLHKVATHGRKTLLSYKWENWSWWMGCTPQALRGACLSNGWEEANWSSKSKTKIRSGALGGDYQQVNDEAFWTSRIKIVREDACRSKEEGTRLNGGTPLRTQLIETANPLQRLLMSNGWKGFQKENGTSTRFDAWSVSKLQSFKWIKILFKGWTWKERND